MTAMTTAVRPDRSFGRLLRRLRTGALLSQEELAERAGLSVRTIRNLEHERVEYPHGTSIRQLAEALGLTGPDRDGFERRSRPAGPEPAHPERGTPGGPGVIPAQLPMGTPVFTGRSAELERLDAHLRPAGGPFGSGLAVLSGGAGTGKTALAVHWAHRRRQAFPDGQLYLDLRGCAPGPALGPEPALESLLAALGVAPADLPAGWQARASLYRSLLADRQALVVLDNVRDGDQARPLLPGGARCTTLVTSRDQLPGLLTAEGGRAVPVRPLPSAEARAMLVARLGADRADREPEAVDEIVRGCAGLPLALAALATRAATRPGFPLATFARELRERPGDLDTFADGDPGADLRTRFSWSYGRLSRPAADLFRRLGSDPAAVLTVAAATALTGLAEPDARRALTELTRAHLADEPSPGRFDTHALVRCYAAELAGARDENGRD